MPNTPDITALSESAVTYDRNLKHLPYAVLSETLGLHGFNLIEGVQNKDVITNMIRKGGMAKPYVPNTVEESEIGKTQERTLEMQKAYAYVRDEPSRFKKTIVGPDLLLGKNKSKRHPWQIEMLNAIVITFGEDIIDALFPAKFDPTDRSAMGLFDGIDTLIDKDITDGLIDAAPAVGNIKNTGTIAKPTGDTDTAAYDIITGFARSAHPFLRKVDSVLMLPYDLGDAYDLAYFNKYKTKPTMDNFGLTVVDGTGGKCRLLRSLAMGKGQRIIMTVPGNFDFGMDTSSDAQFVQIRDIDPDPNFVRFWIQADYGCRIRNVHQKVFQINEGAPVANGMSGDYV